MTSRRRRASPLRACQVLRCRQSCARPRGSPSRPTNDQGTGWGVANAPGQERAQPGERAGSAARPPTCALCRSRQASVTELEEHFVLPDEPELLPGRPLRAELIGGDSCAPSCQRAFGPQLPVLLLLPVDVRARVQGAQPLGIGQRHRASRAGRRTRRRPASSAVKLLSTSRRRYTGRGPARNVSATGAAPSSSIRSS